MKPTNQQQEIINAAIEGKNISIEAGAGCAKSTTLKFIAEALPNKNILYLVFNKDNAEEAKAKFPPNVECRTINSLAYQSIVKHPKSSWGQRLDTLSLNDIKIPSGTDEDQAITWKIFIKKAVTEYMQSGEENIITFILNQFNTTDFYNGLEIADEAEGVKETAIKNLSVLALDYWVELTSEKSKTTISHDVYLKLYQLTKPILIFDIIMVDEFQDSNPVMLDIVLNQKHTQTIVVGDSSQAIYAFRGAVNGFDFIPKNFVKLQLTGSYRYTQDIADLGSSVLRLKNVEFPLEGLAKPREINSKAIVCRTNVGVLGWLVSAIKDNKKVYSNVALKPIYSALYHLEAVFSGKEPKFPSRELLFIKTSKDVAKYAAFVPEINAYSNIYGFIKDNGYNVFSFKQEIENVLTTKEKADYSIITCHKAKGMEYDDVTINWDFVPKLKSDTNIFDYYVENVQEANLLYIGVTRAKTRITLPEDLENLLLVEE